jgi:hypothetical protein
VSVTTEQQQLKEENRYNNMTWTTITKDPAYAEWMETLKPSTELGYRSGIMAICRFYKVKPLDMRG